MEVLLPTDLKGMIVLGVYLFVALFGNLGLAYYLYRLDHRSDDKKEPEDDGHAHH